MTDIDMLPGWFTDVTIGQTIFFLGGLAIIAGTIVKLWKPVRKVFKGLEDISTDWNGTPARHDATGAEIEPAVLGVPAQLRKLRDQLENSHQDSDYPNLRDDLDTKATKSDVAELATAVGALIEKVDEHIHIAKESDERQDKTERIVTKYLPALQKLLED